MLSPQALAKDGPESEYCAAGYGPSFEMARSLDEFEHAKNAKVIGYRQTQ
jgi:hypothetical protein